MLINLVFFFHNKLYIFLSSAFLMRFLKIQLVVKCVEMFRLLEMLLLSYVNIDMLLDFLITTCQCLGQIIFMYILYNPLKTICLGFENSRITNFPPGFNNPVHFTKALFQDSGNSGPQRQR